MTPEKHLEKLLNDDEWCDAFMKRFEEKSGPMKSACLIWTGPTEPSGYGRVSVRKHSPNLHNFFTHRLSYMIQTGEILSPSELILHQCHIRLCGNVDHHHIGNHEDNMADLTKSKNIAGENNPRAKLTEDDVWEILDLYYEGDKEGVWTAKSLSTYFGVGVGTINDAVSGRSWPYIYNEYFEVDE